MASFCIPVNRKFAKRPFYYLQAKSDFTLKDSLYPQKYYKHSAVRIPIRGLDRS